MTVHIIIKGKVQGVFFRASAKELADKLHIKGWVKNGEENVEAIASGDEKNVKEFIAWCKHGPRHASVSEVLVHEIKDENFDEFTVIRK